MTTLPETLRDLARRVDVRVPILPPPGIAPALLAASDELDRLASKVAAQQSAVNEIAARAASRGAELDAVIAAAADARRKADAAVAAARAGEGATAKLAADMDNQLTRLRATVTDAGAHADALAKMQNEAVVLLDELGRVAPMLSAVSGLMTTLRPFIAASASVQRIMEGDVS